MSPYECVCSIFFQCRELYFCVKEAMDKAAARNNGKVPGKGDYVSSDFNIYSVLCLEIRIELVIMVDWSVEELI